MNATGAFVLGAVLSPLVIFAVTKAYLPGIVAREVDAAVPRELDAFIAREPTYGAALSVIRPQIEGELRRIARETAYSSTADVLNFSELRRSLGLT